MKFSLARVLPFWLFHSTLAVHPSEGPITVCKSNACPSTLLYLGAFPGARLTRSLCVAFWGTWRMRPSRILCRFRTNSEQFLNSLNERRVFRSKLYFGLTAAMCLFSCVCLFLSNLVSSLFSLAVAFR